MNDEEIETALRRHRAIPPPDSLRTRVTQGPGTGLVRLTMVDWSLAAATLALIVAAAVTHPATPMASETEVAWDATVKAVAAAFGGGDEALALARMVVPSSVAVAGESR